MIRNLWQQLFSRFLKKYHLSQYFLRSASFKELHQSSYAQQVGQQLSNQLKRAAKLSHDEVYTTYSSHKDGLTELEAAKQNSLETAGQQVLSEPQSRFRN